MKNFVSPKKLALVALGTLMFAFLAIFFYPDLGLVVAMVVVPALLFFALIGTLSHVANSNPDQTKYGWKSVLVGLLALGAVFSIVSLLV